MRPYRVVLLGVLGALSFSLMALVELPLPFFPSYLKYDPGDVPALLAALALGPWDGVAVVVIKNLLFFLSGKNTTGLVGVAANALAGGTFVFVAGVVYHLMRRQGLAWALGAGSLGMTAAMCVANYFVFLPMWGVPKDQVLGVILGSIVWFNLVKVTLSSALTLWLVPRVETVWQRAGRSTRPSGQHPAPLHK